MLRPALSFISCGLLLLPACILPGCFSLSLIPTKLSAVKEETSSLSRREWWNTNLLQLSVGGLLSTWVPEHATAAPITTPYLMEEYFQPPNTAADQGRFYFPTLTPPFAKRATYQYTLGRNAWALEQLLTFANVSATIRCNVVQLESTGGLWVHSPQWPTGEFCYLLDQLQGDVEHIVLPCNALEHKAPMKAFIQKYPKAQVWISPGQYGPFGSCGLDTDFDTKKTSSTMGYRVDGILGDNMAQPPSWAKEFDMAILYVDIPENAGPVSEVAFCHKPTKTLVATDAVVYIPTDAPNIFTTYFDTDTVRDDPTFWPKTVLQAVFLPLRTNNNNNYPGFGAIENRLVRAPILRAFADARAPNAVKDWVAKIATQFDFDRIITSHFASPIAATPQDFASCFSYLTPIMGNSNSKLPPIACQDWELLEGLNQVIAENKLGAPATFDYKKDCQ
ncbi:expressed unknown protein [Seminavis robusta]|uniref:Uncharacterized protein n=1 Tax=Seminavis robusta TaxID=568900 RepID=A0A9N8DVM8_9STRA|nr:expressed unknown protein [Seminavis robusta]|eukprot:Sro377_g130040.1 n/a (448) ;mRNA; f:22749-24092